MPHHAKTSDKNTAIVKLALTEPDMQWAGKSTLLLPGAHTAALPESCADIAICHYRLLAGADSAKPLRGRFVISAPSVIGLLAPALLAVLPDCAGFILDRRWAGSAARLLWLAWRLRYERLRLGSDVESPFLRRFIYRDRLADILPPLSIGQWLKAVGQSRDGVFADPALIFWHDETRSAAFRPWLQGRLYPG